jgi:beta-lactamase class C
MINNHSWKLMLLIGILYFLNLQFAYCQSKNGVELDSVLKKYDAHLSNTIEEGGVPGVAVAIVTDTQIVFIKGYGVREVGKPEPIDLNTSFRIASVSKGFASVLTGILVEDGVLNWDDKVTKYLPEFTLKDSVATQNLTIRHVLSHTSGLMPHAYDNLVEANVSFEKIVNNLKNVRLVCTTGDCYGYQNVAYSLISEIIESAAGFGYTYWLTEKILQPLHMTDVSFSKKGLLARENYAHPHVKVAGEWTATRVRDTYYTVVPAAGINASIMDMAIWLQALMGVYPHVISPEITREIFKPEIETSYERRRFNWKKRLQEAYYGLGWRIFNYAGYTMIFHSGGLRGYLSKLAILPEKKIGIVVMQNAWTRNPLLYQFLDMYLNLDEEEPALGTN